MNTIKLLNALSDVKKIFFKKKESLKSKIVAYIENSTLMINSLNALLFH